MTAWCLICYIINRLFFSLRTGGYTLWLSFALTMAPAKAKYSDWNISGNDLGTEELGHMEMIAALVYQLTQNLCMEDIKKDGFDAYFVDHTVGIYPVSAGGLPFNALALASKGDIITDLHEDLAADGAIM